mmetsp:Transcript_13798/g.52517  ORF Transcript_13798/g.52517 Transcript_13798/m.52517 type:complete len:244 (-) Transcript_13798:32-763(-)
MVPSFVRGGRLAAPVRLAVRVGPCRAAPRRAPGAFSAPLRHSRLLRQLWQRLGVACPHAHPEQKQRCPRQRGQRPRASLLLAPRLAATGRRRVADDGCPRVKGGAQHTGPPRRGRGGRQRGGVGPELQRHQRNQVCDAGSLSCARYPLHRSCHHPGRLHSQPHCDARGLHRIRPRRDGSLVTRCLSRRDADVHRHLRLRGSAGSPRQHLPRQVSMALLLGLQNGGLNEGVSAGPVRQFEVTQK